MAMDKLMPFAFVSSPKPCKTRAKQGTNNRKFQLILGIERLKLHSRGDRDAEEVLDDGQGNLPASSFSGPCWEKAERDNHDEHWSRQSMFTLEGSYTKVFRRVSVSLGYPPLYG